MYRIDMGGIVTDDPAILKRIVTKRPHQDYGSEETCNLCGEKKFWTRRSGYLHQCKARLKSGKAISKKIKY